MGNEWAVTCFVALFLLRDVPGLRLHVRSRRFARKYVFLVQSEESLEVVSQSDHTGSSGLPLKLTRVTRMKTACSCNFPDGKDRC